jgi:hypothetical protein
MGPVPSGPDAMLAQHASMVSCIVGCKPSGRK